MKEILEYEYVKNIADLKIGDVVEAADILKIQYSGTVKSKTMLHVLIDDPNHVHPVWVDFTYYQFYKKLNNNNNNDNNHEIGCDCGAKHTSFPEHHLSWCTTTGKQ